jgi:hypothetical protein
MSDVGQVTAGPSGNAATIAAMADILAAIGSSDGLMEWADEDPVTPAPAGRAVPASGATVGHGRIRLRERPAAPEPEPAPREPVGHGSIRLLDSTGPALPDVTPIATADILDALDSAT